MTRSMVNNTYGGTTILRKRLETYGIGISPRKIIKNGNFSAFPGTFRDILYIPGRFQFIYIYIYYRVKLPSLAVSKQNSPLTVRSLHCQFIGSPATGHMTKVPSCVFFFFFVCSQFPAGAEVRLSSQCFVMPFISLAYFFKLSMFVWTL